MSEVKHSRRKRDDDSATPLFEWLAGGIGAVLFLGALGVLIIEATSSKTPPAIETRLIETVEQRGGWLVRFEAQNSGDQPAEQVEVVVTLGGGKPTATREVTIDFIGPHSARRAGVFFTRDPAGREIAIEAKGYLEP